MADNANLATSGGENPLATILAETAEVQTLAGRVGHLVRTIDRMAETVCSNVSNRNDNDIVRAVIAFAVIADELAGKIADAGERIEMAANAARRS